MLHAMLPQTSMAFSVSRNLLRIGLILMLMLTIEEVSHLNRWDEKGERRFIKPASAAGCTNVPAHPSYRWCEVPGFGRALYRCTRRLCGYQDPSAPFVSLQQMEQEESEMDVTVPVNEDSR